MSSLNVEVVSKRNGKNSFGNSFALSNDFSSQNEYESHVGRQQKPEKQSLANKQRKKVKQNVQVKKGLKQEIALKDPVNKKQNDEGKKVNKKQFTLNKSKNQQFAKPNHFNNRNEIIDIETRIPKVTKKKQETIQQSQSEAQVSQEQVYQGEEENISIENQNAQKFKSKVNEINTNITKLNTNLRDIKQNYAEIDKFAEQEILFKKSDRKKQREIRDFLMQKRLQKESRQKKLKQIRQKESNIMSKTIQQTESKKKKQKEEKIKLIKQKDYVLPKQRYKKYIESQQQGRQLAKSLIQRYKLHQPFHIRKQRQFQDIQQKKKLQEEEILLQRKQRFQSLDLDELQEHKRQYEERKQEIENSRRQQREQKWNKIQQDNALLRDHIWKGPSHDLVDEELAEKLKRKNQPKERVKRIKNYQQFIKNNFLPKTHQPKRLSSIAVHDHRISESLGNYGGRYQIPSDGELAHYDPRKRHVKKYRYFQGKAVGQVVQSIPVARSYSQQKKIGQSYLEYLKNLPKKRQHSSQKTQIDSADLQMISKKFNTITKVKRQPVPFYEQSTKKKTVSLSQKPTKQEVKMVYEQLKNHDFKLKSKRQLIKVMKHNSSSSMDMEKQVSSGLILNMQRKLDLLSKL